MADTLCRRSSSITVCSVCAVATCMCGVFSLSPCAEAMSSFWPTSFGNQFWQSESSLTKPQRHGCLVSSRPVDSHQQHHHVLCLAGMDLVCDTWLEWPRAVCACSIKLAEWLWLSCLTAWTRHAGQAPRCRTTLFTFPLARCLQRSCGHKRCEETCV